MKISTTGWVEEVVIVKHPNGDKEEKEKTEAEPATAE